jgi:hypothetical protein
VNYTSFLFREEFRNVNQARKSLGIFKHLDFSTFKLKKDESYLVLVLGGFASHFSNQFLVTMWIFSFLLDLLEDKQSLSVGDLITLKVNMFL